MSDETQAPPAATPPPIAVGGTTPPSGMPTPITGAAMMAAAAEERAKLLEAAAEIVKTEITWSAEITELAKALPKAQKRITPASKDATNPHFKSKYATLAAHWDSARDALADNGFSVVQLPYAHGRVAVVKTLLLHESGQWICSSLTLVGREDTAQAVCGLITYGRRYAFSAMVGTAPEDDDGNQASTSAGPEGVKVDQARTPNQRANAAAETSRPAPPSTPVTTAAPAARPPAAAPVVSTAGLPILATPATTAPAAPVQPAKPAGQVVTPPPGRPPMRAPGAPPAAAPLASTSTDQK